MRRWAIASVAGLFVVAALTIPSRSGEQDRTPTPEEHDFGSKVVMVTMRSGGGMVEWGGGHMEQVRVRRLGDRSFLVGRSPVGGPRPEYPQTTIWVPVSEVASIVEYDSFEDAKRDYEARKTEHVKGQPN